MEIQESPVGHLKSIFYQPHLSKCKHFLLPQYNKYHFNNYMCRFDAFKLKTDINKQYLTRSHEDES